MPHGGKRAGSGRPKKQTNKLIVSINTALFDRLNNAYPTVKDRNDAIREVLNKNF